MQFLFQSNFPQASLKLQPNARFQNTWSYLRDIKQILRNLFTICLFRLVQFDDSCGISNVVILNVYTPLICSLRDVLCDKMRDEGCYFEGGSQLHTAAAMIPNTDKPCRVTGFYVTLWKSFRWWQHCRQTQFL